MVDGDAVRLGNFDSTRYRRQAVLPGRPVTPPVAGDSPFAPRARWVRTSPRRPVTDSPSRACFPRGPLGKRARLAGTVEDWLGKGIYEDRTSKHPHAPLFLGPARRPVREVWSGVDLARAGSGHLTSFPPNGPDAAVPPGVCGLVATPRSYSERAHVFAPLPDVRPGDRREEATGQPRGRVPRFLGTSSRTSLFGARALFLPYGSLGRLCQLSLALRASGPLCGPTS